MRLKIFPPLLFLSFAPFFSLAQLTAIVGTGTSANDPYTYPAPYGNWYWGAKHQILVRASELTSAGMSAGNITALAFFVDTPAGTPLNGFAIRMKTTLQNNTTTNFSNSGFTTVFGPQNYTESSGWSNHVFSTPFSWDGTSNILIETCFNNGSWTQNAQMRYTPTAFNSVVYYYQDQSNVCTQFSGTTSMNRPNMRFTYSPNGPPTVQFSATPTSSCNGAIQFIDQSFSGITAWLWNFGDGNTSTIQNPLHTYTTSGSYSVSLTVTNANGNNSLTKPNYINVALGSGPIAPSCIPQTLDTSYTFGITNFTFNNINNTSADNNEKYADFSCGVDTVLPGQWYTISVSTPSPAQHNVRVWIDFNNDGAFSVPSEEVFSANNSFIANGTVFIPATATLNTALRLRVSADHNLLAPPTPCSNLQYGQAEDYALYVKPNTNPPVANFSADDTLSCSGIINFTDFSQNLPVSWLWNFGDGATSNSQSPSHTYTASGTYSVSLTVTNANGNNTLVKSNYITVTLGNTPIAPSCQPVTFNYCCGYGIYKVIFNTINHSSQDAVEGYQDFSCEEQTTINEGQPYAISIQTSPANVQDTKVWIDLNNDGAFSQANELVFSSLNSINPTGSITVPLSAAVYNTLLRMRVSSDVGGTNQSFCDPLIQGQAEDYGVIINSTVGVGQPATGDQLSVMVYPNPFSETAVFEMVNNQSSMAGVEFKIYDMYGIEVKSFQIYSSRFIINREHLSSGIYFYEMIGENHTIATGKLIIQ